MQQYTVSIKEGNKIIELCSTFNAGFANAIYIILDGLHRASKLKVDDVILGVK